MLVHPTNKCFDDAMEYLEASVLHEVTDHPATIKLVHGICKIEDKRYSHAWIENFTQCIDCGIVEGKKIYLKIPKARFYRERQVLDTTKYTVPEALEQNLEHGTFGPWLQKYLELTRNYV